MQVLYCEAGAVSPWIGLFNTTFPTVESRDSAGSIAIRLRAGQPRNRVSTSSRAGDVSLLQMVQFGCVWFTQPHIQWVPAAKRPGLEADDSLPFRSKVKNEWSCTFISSRLHGV